MKSILQSKRALFAATTVALSTAAAGHERPVHFSSQQLFEAGAPDQGRAGAATLTRTRKNIAMTINASELHGGHAYTVWWFVFNEPGACENPMGEHARCSSPDVDNPAVKGAILWAAGAITDDSGTARFEGELVKGRPPEGMTVSSRGIGKLLDPKGAEVHVVVVRHPPAASLGDLIDEALTTPNAGCAGSCPSEVAAVFPSPEH